MSCTIQAVLKSLTLFLWFKENLGSTLNSTNSEFKYSFKQTHYYCLNIILRCYICQSNYREKKTTLWLEGVESTRHFLSLVHQHKPKHLLKLALGVHIKMWTSQWKGGLYHLNQRALFQCWRLQQLQDVENLEEKMGGRGISYIPKWPFLNENT